MGASLYNASFTTIIQEEIHPNMLGRVFSLYYSIVIIPSVISLLCTRFIADFIGVTKTFVILGFVVSLVGIASFLTPPLMRLGKKTIKGLPTFVGYSFTFHPPRDQ